MAMANCYITLNVEWANTTHYTDNLGFGACDVTNIEQLSEELQDYTGRSCCFARLTPVVGGKAIYMLGDSGMDYFQFLADNPHYAEQIELVLVVNEDSTINNYNAAEYLKYMTADKEGKVETRLLAHTCSCDIDIVNSLLK